MDFLTFLWQCILEGFELGDGLVLKIDSTCVFIGVGFKLVVWLSKSIKQPKEKRGAGGRVAPTTHGGLNEWWHHTENKVMAVGVGLSLAVFLVSTVFVAPYQKFKEQRERADKTTVALNNATNRLTKALDDLAESKDQRLRKVEDLSVTEIRDLKKTLLENDKKYIEDLATKEPELARLARIASNVPPPIIVTNGPISIQSLRAEQKEIEDRRVAEVNRLEAGRLVENITDLRSNETYVAFLSSADAMMKTLTNQLSLLAEAVGDKVICDYVKMPEFIISDMPHYAVVRLQHNQYWEFDFSIRSFLSVPNRRWATITSTRGGFARVVYNKNAPQLTFVSGKEGFPDVPPDGRAEAIAKIIRSLLRSQDSAVALTNVVH